ncbi:AcrR family transcriptional regulator [Lipingzhangella halophila]|uniref:AcrR family transcriptional regulator n=1 Tax=Lipingzhangella halophila TaxID=1783352 RepID=A0A7W7RD30_9ACTN|nr:TetR/AcrR family transcriptional regulator [Lipingzhangella halophila]MBB4929749.1 AcrR family transcriptional regulator [Lipingzhangella halophila]
MPERDYPDHRRVFALLWRAADDPSPRSGLTVGGIVDAAVELADESGLGGVSMRRIAERLGVGTMSLYTYVSSKAELVPVMLDSMYGELAQIAAPEKGWRARLESLAHGYWDLFHRHPWMLEVPVSRPLPGPNTVDRQEAEFEIVDGIGLDELEMNSVLELVRNHTGSAARHTMEIARDAERSGVSDDQWWYAVEPLFTSYLAGRYLPLTARVGEAIGAPHSDPRREFEFGLARILDGLEDLVVSRSRSG